MSFIVVIPARLASTRLPGKILLDIGGKPMLQHVYERALASDASAVYIATDDEGIEAVAKTFTKNVMMTSIDHQSGTDRIQEVTAQLRLEEDRVVVNVQGDEPLIPPAAINQVANNLITHPAAGIASLWEEISSAEVYEDPNAVKVVTDAEDFALYFSRSPLPSVADKSVFDVEESKLILKRHIGIYAYRVSVLNSFVNWTAPVLEKSEKLEQLRALHFGVKIHMARTVEKVPPGVDTQKDLDAVRKIIKE